MSTKTSLRDGTGRADDVQAKLDVRIGFPVQRADVVRRMEGRTVPPECMAVREEDVTKGSLGAFCGEFGRRSSPFKGEGPFLYMIG
jgi:hypothetical protein